MSFQNRPQLLARIAELGGTPPAGFATRKELVAKIESLEPKIEFSISNGPSSTGPIFMNASKLEAEANRLRALVAESKAITAKLPPRATAPAAKQATPAAVRPATMQAARPAPVATAPSGTMTAASFTQSQARPVMVKSEWDKLSQADRSSFIREAKGRIIDDPEPAKPHKDAFGNLTRAGFDAMTPAAKSAHCRAGKPILD